MCFPKVEIINIDGTNYEISNGAMVDMWGSREALVFIYDYIDPQRMEMELSFETYTSWRKDLIKACKDWDRIYLKHVK